MELHAADAAALDDGRKWLAVFADGYRVARDRRHEAVREIHLRFRRHAGHDCPVALEAQAVPTHMRDFERPAASIDARQAPATSRQDAEPGAVSRLVAAFEQPLHAEADA